MGKFFKVLAAVLVAASVVCGQTINWAASTITVTTEAQLREMANLVNNGTRTFLNQTVRLGNDIALTSDWIPIGFDPNNTARRFRGTFDGNGFSVSNISISGFERAGFFGTTVCETRIRNLFLDIDTIWAQVESRNTYAGGLIAHYMTNVRGTTLRPIENIGINIRGVILAHSSVKTHHPDTNTSSYAGGIIGLANDDIRIHNSFVVSHGRYGICITASASDGGAQVRARAFAGAGGLIGFVRRDVEINRSYTATSVHASAGGNNTASAAFAGGLVGFGNNGSQIGVTHAYASGTVGAISPPRGHVREGGIHGILDFWVQHNSVYFNNQGASRGVGNPEATVAEITRVGIAGRTLAQLRTQSTFSGWNFTTVWAINSAVNNGTPHLRKIAGGTATRPTLANRTHNSITINEVARPASGQIVEYAINTTNTAPTSGWQTGLIFSELTANTPYFIFARSQTNNLYNTGTVSASLSVTTVADPNVGQRNPGAAVTRPTLASVTQNSITINAVSVPANGQIVEYAISTTNSAPISGWQTTTTFSGLNASTNYFIFARSQENTNFFAGTPSLGLSATTSAAGGGGGGNIGSGVQLISNNINWHTGQGGDGTANKTSDNPIVASFNITNANADWAEVYSEFSGDFTGLTSISIRGQSNTTIRLHLVGTADTENWTYGNRVVELQGTFDTTVTISQFNHAWGTPGRPLNLSEVTGISIGNGGNTGAHNFTINSLTLNGMSGGGGGNIGSGVQLISNSITWITGQGANASATKTSDNPLVASLFTETSNDWAEVYPGFAASFIGLTSISIRGQSNTTIRLHLVGTADTENWTYGNYVVELEGAFDTTVTISQFRRAWGADGRPLNLSEVTNISIGNGGNAGNHNFTINSLILNGVSGSTSIRNNQPRDNRHGILLERPIVSDFARISVITPEPATINLRIMDNLGNVVFTETSVGAGLKPAPTNAADNAIIWNLTNPSGRYVANGTYLIIVEATGISGRKFTYSSRVGVNR